VEEVTTSAIGRGDRVVSTNTLLVIMALLLTSMVILVLLHPVVMTIFGLNGMTHNLIQRGLVAMS
jgi:hypothetical protein